MRFIYACFKGYIGFYNGLDGLEKLEIDFTKCKHNTVLILGKNGSGKSTLMNAMNLFPDPSYSFVPNLDGEKILRITDNENLYEIRIISPTDLKGGRKQTKAFISKNGKELNENGNITSYKEIIFSEFELDSNYISLSKLSSDDRGLGDKTPAERKKFASSIIDNLETYNNIYKTLNKKSLIFKSHINTLHTKIQNIGNKSDLETLLFNLKNQETELSNKILDTNNNIVAIEAKNSIDESEAEEITSLTSDIEKLSNQNETDLSLITMNCKRFDIKPDEINNKWNELISLIEQYKNKRNEYDLLWRESGKKSNELAVNISDLEAQITLKKSSIDKSIEDNINNTQNKINEITNIIKSMGYKPDTSLIIPLISILDLYDRIIKQIDVLYDNIDIEKINFIINNENIDILSLENELYNIEEKIKKNHNTLRESEEIVSRLMLLNMRPKNCKDDSCHFISSIIKLENESGGLKLIKHNMDLIIEENEKLGRDSIELRDKIDLYHSCLPKITILGMIKKEILENLDKLQFFKDKILSTNEFIERLRNLNQFNELRDPRELIELSNLLKELDRVIDYKNEIDKDYIVYKEQVNYVNENSKLLEQYKEEFNKILSDITKYKSDMDNFTQLVESTQHRKRELESIIEIKKRYDSNLSEYNMKKSKLEVYEKKSKKAIESISIIQKFRSDIDNYNKMLSPIKIEIQRLSGQLAMIDSYYEEYNQYKAKYDMIETLKKYCSPTGGGIQTIFMQLYMDKTLELSNQVLSMLFGGEYRLLDFIINANEFRIPFIGSGLPVDDISSGSSSQISIIGMVINLVLLHQGSTKFNIARLDEVDGAADSKNRAEFATVLNHIIKLLNIEQLFIISHSLEINASMCDIIKLKSYEDYDNPSSIGNVIFDYQDLIKTIN